MKNIVFTSMLFLVIFVLASCEKYNPAPDNQLDNVWIEMSERSDTLTFLKESLLRLDRGREFRRGHLLPKRGVGIYKYKIKGDSVALLSFYSSCYNCFTDYFFSIENDTLKIGDFYQKDSTQLDVLIFVKQK